MTTISLLTQSPTPKASTQRVEVYRLWLDGTWDTGFYSIPADTPEDDIERVARLICLQHIRQPCAGVGLYFMDEEYKEDEEDNDDND